MSNTPKTGDTHEVWSNGNWSLYREFDQDYQDERGQGWFGMVHYLDGHGSSSVQMVRNEGVIELADGSERNVPQYVLTAIDKHWDELECYIDPAFEEDDEAEEPAESDAEPARDLHVFPLLDQDGNELYYIEYDQEFLPEQVLEADLTLSLSVIPQAVREGSNVITHKPTNVITTKLVRLTQV